MKFQIVFCASLAFILLGSCSAYQFSVMNNEKMKRLDLGMSKSEVSGILGQEYTISKKGVVDQDTLEVISYRNFPYDDEFYLFQFRNNRLEKWEREFQIRPVVEKSKD